MKNIMTMEYPISILDMELDGLNSYKSILGRRDNKSADVLPEMKEQLTFAISYLEKQSKELLTSAKSASCKGEKCSVCGKDATNKLSEVVFHDDPLPQRHEMTAYVCKQHFKMIIG